MTEYYLVKYQGEKREELAKTGARCKSPFQFAAGVRVLPFSPVLESSGFPAPLAAGGRPGSIAVLLPAEGPAARVKRVFTLQTLLCPIHGKTEIQTTFKNPTAF